MKNRSHSLHFFSLIRYIGSFLFILGFICIGSCSKDPIKDDITEWNESTFSPTLLKKSLKVLDIGNSYSDGASSMLPVIVTSCGANVEDMCLYQIIRGGGSFKNWCDIYNDSDNHSYYFRRVLGGVDVHIKTEEASAGDGELFRRVLTEVDWDIIILHQVSTYAPYYDLWKGKDAGGYLDELLDIIRRHQPKTELGFILVHSYWDEYSGNKEKSSLARWEKIAYSVQQLQKDYCMNIIIPYGTAVENLRASSYNNEYDLTMDGTHCGYGLCQYTAACCYYESLIAPRSRISCYGSFPQVDVSNKSSKYPAVNVTRANSIVAQRAAILACKNMFQCLNPEEN